MEASAFTLHNNEIIAPPVSLSLCLSSGRSRAAAIIAVEQSTLASTFHYLYL